MTVAIQCQRPLSTKRAALQIGFGVLGLFVLFTSSASRGSPFDESGWTGITLEWRQDSDDPTRWYVELTGEGLQQAFSNVDPQDLQAKIQSTFSIYVVEDDQRTESPVLAKLQTTKGGWQLHPRFRLKPGVTYEAVFKENTDRPVSERSQRITLKPHTPTKATRLAHVYPSGDSVPENLLRCYLVFDAPMSKGYMAKYIHLYDDEKNEVELPFLLLDEELWNGSMTRLTLLLDPARVKRGLVPNQEMGRALQPGRTYELVIDAGWPDAQGQPLAESHVKKWRVSRADYQQPEIARWEVQAPRAQTREPLTVQFNAPLDHALAQRLITVTDHRGKTLAGEVQLEKEETRWKWTPQAQWQPQTYVLLIDTRLADACGNSLRKPFEVMSGSDKPAEPSKIIKLPFEVAAAD
jgi:hypothetical protein